MISYPEFGAQTTATQVAQAFSNIIRDKTILITGISPNSLGSAPAHSLSSYSPRLLLLASRTPSNVSLVASKLRAAHPSLPIIEVSLDLASLKSVRSAAAHIISTIGDRSLDVLFDNAGINVSKRELSGEGTELQFATNHIGPFLLTNLLLPLLSRSGDGRVVITSSEAHRISPVRFSDYNLEAGKLVPRNEEPRRELPEGMLRGDGEYDGAVAYGQSKTANVLFAVGLNMCGRVRGFAVNPGTIRTDLVRGLDEGTMKQLVASTEVWKTADQGAATLVVAGFDPLLDSTKDLYLNDCQPRRPSKWASDSGNADRLWALSLKLVGEDIHYGKGSRL